MSYGTSADLESTEQTGLTSGNKSTKFKEKYFEKLNQNSTESKLDRDAVAASYASTAIIHLISLSTILLYLHVQTRILSRIFIYCFACCLPSDLTSLFTRTQIGAIEFAGTTWHWAHNGVNANGEVHLHKNGKILWDHSDGGTTEFGNKEHGAWTVSGNQLLLDFNNIPCTMEIDAEKTLGEFAQKEGRLSEHFRGRDRENPDILKEKGDVKRKLVMIMKMPERSPPSRMFLLSDETTY